MSTTTTRGLRRSRAITALITAAVVGVTTFGINAVAEEDEGGGETPPPGTIENATQAKPAGDTLQKVATSGSTYDPTILTKFVPGGAFDPFQGQAGSARADIMDVENNCIHAHPTSGGSRSVFFEAVELPDGSRIKRLRFYGRNDSPTETINVALLRSRINIPAVIGPSPSQSSTIVGDFSVPASSGVTQVLGPDDLMEITGSNRPSIVAGTDHNFHTVRVTMDNAADMNQQLCGIEIEYQVPTAENPGSVLHPVTPYRAYDSRKEMAPTDDGPLASGPGRVVPVKDGRDVNSGVINAPDVIPAEATAVAFTITAVGTANEGFLSIAPGDAAALTSSILNWTSDNNGAIASSGVVKLDSNRQVKVFADGFPGAESGFLIDITGYYAPPTYPNMGN